MTDFYFIGRVWASRMEKYAFFWLIVVGIFAALAYYGVERLQSLFDSKSPITVDAEKWVQIIQISKYAFAFSWAMFCLFASMSISMNVVTGRMGHASTDLKMTWARLVPEFLFWTSIIGFLLLLFGSLVYVSSTDSRMINALREYGFKF